MHPLAPFDDHERDDLQAAGFSIAADNKHVRCEDQD
jgi:hypothetical protein